MKIYIFTQHFGVAGGGERHACSFIACLSKYYDVTVGVMPGAQRFVPEISRLFGIDLSRCRIEDLDKSKIQDSDVYINISHFQLLKPMARRNILVTFFPQMSTWDVSGYDTIIANSFYTKSFVQKFWGRDDAVVIYPPCDIEPFKPLDKDKSIVTVGRFFWVPRGNNKNHMLMINAFKSLELDDWTFHMVGSIQDHRYFLDVSRAVEGDRRFKFHHDISLEQIAGLFGRANFLWHASGYGSDDPASQEHFGMVVVEAGAAGAVPVVYGNGGMPEFGSPTWIQPHELSSITRTLINDQDEYAKLQSDMMAKAPEFSEAVSHEQLMQVIEDPKVLVEEARRRDYYVGPTVPMVSDGDEVVGTENVKREGKFFLYYCRPSGQSRYTKRWVQVEIRNKGEEAWDEGTHAFKAFWCSYPDAGMIPGQGGVTIRMKSRIEPGQSARLGVLIPTPPISSGRLILRVDVLKNNEQWISSLQSMPLLAFRIVP